MSSDATQAPAQSAAAEIQAALEAQDQPNQSDQQPPEQGQGAAQQQANQTEAPDPFADNFDPASLPPELQPAYRQLRGDYTRKTQELAEQRKQAESAQALINDLRSDDPEAKQGALQWMAENGLLTPEQTAQVFGWEIDQPQEPTEDDPLSSMQQEWEAFKAEREQERQQAQLEQYMLQEEQRANESFTEIENEIGDELSDRAKTLIVSRAVAAASGGPLDIRAAFDELEAEFTDRQAKWATNKTAPSITPGGATATEVPDLSNERARQDHLAEQIELLNRNRTAS